MLSHFNKPFVATCCDNYFNAGFDMFSCVHNLCYPDVESPGKFGLAAAVSFKLEGIVANQLRPTHEEKRHCRATSGNESCATDGAGALPNACFSCISLHVYH